MYVEIIHGFRIGVISARMALSCRKKVVSVELPLKSGLRSPLSATDLNTRGKTLHIILVKGHFFSDDSALTNR